MKAEQMVGKSALKLVARTVVLTVGQSADTKVAHLDLNLAVQRVVKWVANWG